MKKFLEEFKTFITKGNVLDMAVGVIVGGAFGAITSSLVANVITPLLAWLFGTPNTDALNITLRAADEAAGTEALVLGLGTFVGAIINFLVIALVLFSVIKESRGGSRRCRCRAGGAQAHHRGAAYRHPRRDEEKVKQEKIGGSRSFLVPSETIERSGNT